MKPILAKYALRDKCFGNFFLKYFSVFNIIVLFAKFIYSIVTNFKGNSFEDWNIAQNLVKYGTYSEFINVGATAYKLPVYPFFLAFFIKIFPNFPKEVIVLVQHILLFFVPYIIIRILKIFEREKVGVLGAYIFILSPAYFFYSNVIEATNIFIPIFLLWLYFYFIIFKQDFSYKNWILLSILTAILFLTQIVVVPIVVVLLFALMWIKKLGVKKLTILLIITSFLYSPWIIRNAVTFNKFIPTKTPVWQNIYFSFTPNVSIWDSVMLISSSHEAYTFNLRHKVDEFTMEQIYKEETLKVLKGNEEKIVLKAVQNAVLLWYVPSRYFYDNSLKILFGRKIFVFIINILTFCALLYYYKRIPLLFWGYILLFIGFTIPYMIGHAANTRFKLDFEWAQYILVALFLYEYLKCDKMIKK